MMNESFTNDITLGLFIFTAGFAVSTTRVTSGARYEPPSAPLTRTLTPRNVPSFDAVSLMIFPSDVILIPGVSPRTFAVTGPGTLQYPTRAEPSLRT